MKEVNIKVNADTKQAEQNLDSLGNSADNASQQMLGVAETAFTVAETITGSFAIAVGAIGLFAGENEKMQKVAAKANSVIAIALGVRQLAEQKVNVQILANTAATKLNAAANRVTAATMRALGIATTTTTASFKAMKVALITTGIGALVVGLGFAIERIMRMGKKQQENTGLTEEQTEAIKLNSIWISNASKQYVGMELATSKLEESQVILNVYLEDQQRLLSKTNEKLAEARVLYGENSEKVKALELTQRNYENSIITTTQAIDANTEAIEKNRIADEKAKQEQLEGEQAIIDAKYAMAGASADMFGSISALAKEGSAAQKAAGLAEIAINTGVGFMQGLTLAQKASENLPGLAGVLAFPIFYASQIAAVLGAAAQAKAILQSGGTGGGAGGGIGGGATYTAPYVPESTEQGTPTVTGNGEGGAVQAYVVSTQMTNQQALDEELELQSTL